MLGDHLIEFVTVVRSGSLAAAAPKLALSASSLSRHMHDLETQLGLQLLERHADGVGLTEAGRYVYDHAANIADEVDDIASYARRHASGQASALVVYGVAELPSYLRAFTCAVTGNQPAPERRPRFPRHAELGCQRAGDLLERKEVDIALLRPTELEAAYNDAFELVPFCREQVVAMVDASSPLAGRESIAITDLEGSVLLHADSHFDQAYHAWLEFKALLRKHGVSYVAENRELATDTDWFAGADRGTVPLSAAHRAVSVLMDAGKVRVPIDGVRYTYYAVLRRGDRYAQAVVDRARKALEDARR